MKAINFKEAKTTLKKEGCLDLPSRFINGEIISCWDLSFKEKIKLLFGSKIWLHILGNTHPPVYLSTDYPFNIKEITRDCITCKYYEYSDYCGKYFCNNDNTCLSWGLYEPLEEFESK